MKKQTVIDFEKSLATKEIPEFAAGDTVAVSYRIDEGGTRRDQVFKGTVISKRGEGMGEYFTVRKVTQGYGVERVFPCQSPFISQIKIEKRGRVRRAKLYYLRDRTGRATRIAEKIVRKDKAAATEAKAAAPAEKAPAAEETASSDS